MHTKQLSQIFSIIPRSLRFLSFREPMFGRKTLWGRMIEDMEFIVKTNKPHFFGSIILKEGRRPNLGENFTDCQNLLMDSNA